MQYSSSSFADGWGEFMPGLRSQIRRIRTLFPRDIRFHAQFQDPLGGFVGPRTDRLALRLLRYRRLQQGQLPLYLLYILITLITVFLWLIIRPRLLG
jgi:hypothetical protein